MKYSDLSKKEKDIADQLHYELSVDYKISYERCLKLAKKIYDLHWR